jgi:hypothetical protein
MEILDKVASQSMTVPGVTMDQVYLYLESSRYLTDTQVSRIRQQVNAQYAGDHRKYYTLGYLGRVIHNVGMMINMLELCSAEESPSVKERCDIWLTTLYHKICQAQRQADSAERVGTMTKLMLDELHYPGAQRIATLVTMSDLRHFPHAERRYSSPVANIIRDAVLAEWVTMPDRKYQQWIMDMRTDMCLSKEAVAKLFETTVGAAVTKQRIDFATQVAGPLFEEDLMNIFTKVHHYLITTKKSKKGKK